jgi:uncharacterized membrane protein
MKKINTDKYSKESLEFINRLSEKLTDESITSIREITNRSYFIIGAYFSIQIFCLTEIINSKEQYNEMYLLIILGFFIPVLFIFKNIFPTKINKVGSKGSLLINEYFEELKENQIKEYYSSRIEDLDDSINSNFSQINIRIQRVKWSFFSAIIVVFISCFFWYLLTKGLV